MYNANLKILKNINKLYYKYILYLTNTNPLWLLP